MSKRLSLEQRIDRLEKAIKNESARAVADKEIPNYIKELYTKELEDYFKDHIFSKYAELTPRRFVELLERTKGEMKFIMGNVMSSVIYSGKIEDIDKDVCRRLFMDITDNPKPKTAFLKKLHEKYLLEINENISAGSNDDMSDDELVSAVEDWFTDNMAPSRYDYEKEWLRDLRYMAKGNPNGSDMDDCMDEIEAPEEYYDKVIEMLAELAKNAIADHKENKRRGYDGVGAWRIDHF